MATPPPPHPPSLMIYRKGSRSPSRSAPGTKGVLCLGLGGFSRRRFMDGGGQCQGVVNILSSEEYVKYRTFIIL